MEFITIEEHKEAQIVEKKSKFIANLFPIENVAEAEAIIKQMKKKYYDARHNCIAYRVVENDQIIEKSSDDGEPSGTAGAPMLDILKKNNLANVVVIVTRYFGGTLLGTGGLVRAYSDSLLKAIDQSIKVHKCDGVEIYINATYSDFENFKYYCKNHQILITNVQYSEMVECKIELEVEKKERLWKDFRVKEVNINDLKELNKKYVTKSIEKK